MGMIALRKFRGILPNSCAAEVCLHMTMNDPDRGRAAEVMIVVVDSVSTAKASADCVDTNACKTSPA